MSWLGHIPLTTGVLVKDRRQAGVWAMSHPNPSDGGTEPHPWSLVPGFQCFQTLILWFLMGIRESGDQGPNCKRQGRLGTCQIALIEASNNLPVVSVEPCSCSPSCLGLADFMVLGGKSLPNINPSGLGGGLSSSLLWNQTPVFCLFSHFPKCHHIFHWQSSNFIHCGLFCAHCFCRLSFFFPFPF